VSVYYASQTTYRGGSLMCMSASLHWLVAVLHLGYAPIMPRDTMDRVMRAAATAHARACASTACVTESGMLHSDELLRYTGLPAGMAARAVPGHVMDAVDAGFGETMHIDSISSQLTDCSRGLLVTACDHCVALVRCAGEVCMFDPLPASVACMPLAAHDVRQALTQALGRIDEFDCLVVRQEKTVA
jgi:hypothetical protein